MPRKTSLKYSFVPCPCPADHTSQQFSSKRRQDQNGDDTQNSGLGHCMRVAEGQEDRTVICTTCSDRWGHSQASSAMFKSRSQTNSLTQALDAYPAYKAACSGEDRNPLEWRLYYRKWLSQDESGTPHIPDNSRSPRKRRQVGEYDPTREEKRTLIHSDNAIRGWQSRRVYNEVPEEITSVGPPEIISETFMTQHPPVYETDLNRPQEGNTASYDYNVPFPSEASPAPTLINDSTVEDRLYSTFLSEGYGSFDATGYEYGLENYLMTGIPSSCGYSTNPDYTEPDWDIPEDGDSQD
ncbi:hypothetical protein V866_005233 [Kwoniella sp. B9012]|uniref:Uncharacterized protein n=1 Tax=Kwoniella europaea PYCC6329 TaxID=1423913 RepID=A0AAX4KL16_9TREE